MRWKRWWRAIYLDAGFDACRDAVLPWFTQAIDELPAGKVGKDAKTRLQEWLQARQRPLPIYELVAESGDDHAKMFSVSCTLTDPTLTAEGEGSSRRAAEQAAAEGMLHAARGFVALSAFVGAASAAALGFAIWQKSRLSAPQAGAAAQPHLPGAVRTIPA